MDAPTPRLYSDNFNIETFKKNITTPESSDNLFSSVDLTIGRENQIKLIKMVALRCQFKDEKSIDQDIENLSDINIQHSATMCSRIICHGNLSVLLEIPGMSEIAEFAGIKVPKDQYEPIHISQYDTMITLYKCATRVQIKSLTQTLRLYNYTTKQDVKHVVLLDLMDYIKTEKVKENIKTLLTAELIKTTPTELHNIIDYYTSFDDEITKLKYFEQFNTYCDDNTAEEIAKARQASKAKDNERCVIS